MQDLTSPRVHGVRAVDHLRHWMALRASLQKFRIKQMSLQVGVIAFFGFFVALWLEVSMFLLLSAVMRAHWAAVITFVINLAVIMIARAMFRAAEQRAHAELLAQAERERAEAGDELATVRDELAERTSELVQAQLDRVVVPLQRYKVPVALGSTFVVGMLVAKAVLPDQK